MNDHVTDASPCINQPEYVPAQQFVSYRTAPEWQIERVPLAAFTALGRAVIS
jgi:hypothetical protein